VSEHPVSVTHLLSGFLALSFVLTGLRRQTEFFVVEPWQFVAVICLSAWAKGILRDRRLSVELDEIGLIALAVVAGAWLSFFGALDLITWFKRALRITALFGLYLFLVRHLRDERELFTFLRFTIWACAAASSVMIGQVIEWISEGANLERLQGGGLRGTFLNANEGSTYIAMFIVLAMALWQRQGDKSWMSGKVAAAILSLCAIGILTGQSRTGMAVLVLGATIVLIGSKRTESLLSG